jgi:hypothetical protein
MFVQGCYKAPQRTQWLFRVLRRPRPDYPRRIQERTLGREHLRYTDPDVILCHRCVFGPTQHDLFQQWLPVFEPEDVTTRTSLGYFDASRRVAALEVFHVHLIYSQLNMHSRFSLCRSGTYEISSRLQRGSRVSVPGTSCPPQYRPLAVVLCSYVCRLEDRTFPLEVRSALRACLVWGRTRL